MLHTHPIEIVTEEESFAMKMVFYFRWMLMIAVVLMTACVADSTKNGTTSGGASGVVNRLTTSNVTASAFNEDTQSIITLVYTDLDSNLASSCSISSLSNVSVTQACSCSVGVCTVGVTGAANYNGSASFKYYVVANGATSTTSTVSMTINPLADPPTVIAATITNLIYENQQSAFLTLNYNDPDGDRAGVTDCQITSATNLSVTSACSCDVLLGNCSLKITGTNNYNGSASFSYSIRTNGVWSNTATASLTIINVDNPPVAVAISPASFNEDTQSIITLSYSDIDNDKASSCTISTPTNITVTQACACNGAGVCTVGVKGTSNYNGAASFNYTVTANSATSNSVLASLTILPVDDAPVAAAITPASFNEDMQSIITLIYTDVESNKATTCTIISPSNITVTQACSCNASGVCTVGVTGTSNYYGAATFNYTVTANALTSNSASASLAILAVNDPPTIDTISAVYTNQNQAAVVSFVINDVDGALSCSVVMSATISTNATLIPIGNIVFSGTYPNCQATVTPAAGLSGSSTLTFQVNDGLANASTTVSFTVRAAVAHTWKFGDVGDIDTYALSSANIAKTAAGIAYLVPTAINQTQFTSGDFTGLPVNLSWSGANSVVKRNETVTAPFTETYFSPVYDGLKSTSWNSLTINEALPSLKGLPDSSAIALIPLDELSGSLVEKYNNLSFTATGAPTYNIAGKINKSITFSGTSQYFQTPFSAYLNPTNQFSVCTWVKPALITGSYKSFFTSRDTNKGYAFYVNNSKFEFWIGNGTSFTQLIGTSTPSTIAFSLVCGTYDGTTASLSVNGTVETTTSSSFSPNTLKPARIAAGQTETTATEFFNGTIDDIVVFNRALTASELTSLNALTVRVSQQNGETLANHLFNNELITDFAQLSSATLESAMVGMWHYNELGSSTSTRNSVTGLLEPVSGGLTLGGAGKFSGAASFDGTSSYIATSTAIATNVSSGLFTYSTWFKTTSSAITGRFISFSAAHSPIGISAGKLQFRLNSANTSGLTTITDGLWHHVAVTGNGTTCRVYLDGNVTTPEISPTCAATAMGTAINIGRAVGATEYYQGMLEESALWNRVLSTAEITQLYRRGLNKLSFDVRSCANVDCSDGVFTGTTQSQLNNKDSLGNIYNTPLKINFSIANNRYFQYKAIFYSDVSGHGPELSKVVIGPAHYSYPTSDEYISTQNALSFKSLSAFTQTLGSNGCVSGVRYQLSKDQVNWSYYNGTSWVTGTSYTTANVLADLNTGLATYTSASPIVSDTVYLRAFLKSTSANECELDQAILNGNN